MQTVVELEGVNGEWFTLAGPNEGDKGVYLGTGLKGLYDPPVKVVYEEPGNYPGARYLNHRILRRDIVFGVEILNDPHDTWMSRDSEWRKAWAFDRDCKLYITTEDSGTRYLKLRLGEAMEISLETDPDQNSINQALMVCIAGDPFWYQDDVVYSAVTQTDTTFDPSPLPWPWPQDSLPTETLYIEVDPADGKGGLNPTDQDVFLKWQVPGSTEAPAEPYVPGLPWLGAPKSPAVTWTIPDYSYSEEEWANRRLRLPSLIGGLRTNEVQGIYIDGRPTGGSFTIGYNGETTSAIPYNASAATVRGALNALAGIASGDVNVVQSAATNEVQTIQLTGGPTGGTYTLTFDGQTTVPIGSNSSANQVASALSGLSNIGYADVRCSVETVNEIQRIEVTGEPTGGTFTLSLDGQVTAPIPYNATTIQVASALHALPNIELGECSVSGENLWLWGPYKVEFVLGLGGLNVNQLVADPSGLVGGAGMDVKVTTERQGGAVYTVEFRGALSGLNLPQMTANGSGLQGGVTPAVVVATAVQGSRPYVVEFDGNLSGVDVPAMTINTAGLTGGSPSGYVAVAREGFTAPAENAVIDTDPRVEQVSSDSGSQLWARMNGVRFRNPIPAYTKSRTFEITVSGTVPGQMVTLRIPRPWSRPWGLQ